MARGRKRHRSLFELMDPKGAYRAPALREAASQEHRQAEAEGKAEAEVEAQAEPEGQEKPTVEETAAAELIEQAEEQISAEPEPVATEQTVQPAAEASEDSRPTSEPILAAKDGKVRLVTNYPLAAMLCFAGIILLICAILVGWRLGYDRCLKDVSQVRQERGEEIRDEDPGTRSWFENQ